MLFQSVEICSQLISFQNVFNYHRLYSWKKGMRKEWERLVERAKQGGGGRREERKVKKGER